ncbi:cell division protein [Bifidobacterium phasiani]|uniref:Cell division protein n=1 Tax=Bifidobacterium phasiani TaxID=2834431 RepID=A0ABS6W8D1_9BIFI|nr:cell division protein [Bifidobacterium phasiani]MBW3082763.1 cell division protein [Bifidobacterium phasiani]
MADETQHFDDVNDATDEHDVATEPYLQSEAADASPKVKPLFPPMPDMRQTDDGLPVDPAASHSREEFTTVYDIIDRLEQMLDEAKSGFFTPGVVKVDREEFTGHLTELKKMLPVQLERASALMREAERRLENAQTQANAIIASAQSRAADRIREADEQAQFLAGQENVTELARQKARSIIDQAQAKSDKLTQGADRYCTDVMESLHQQLAKFDHDVQAGLNVLRERQRAAAEQLPHIDDTTEE